MDSEQTVIDIVEVVIHAAREHANTLSVEAAAIASQPGLDAENRNRKVQEHTAQAQEILAACEDLARDVGETREAAREAAQNG